MKVDNFIFLKNPTPLFAFKQNKDLLYFEIYYISDNVITDDPVSIISRVLDEYIVIEGESCDLETLVYAFEDFECSQTNMYAKKGVRLLVKSF